MPVQTLPACDALTRLADFDTIIDARTEDEYALDHVPGAINWPTLNNEERITIGTMYKQVNAFEAKKRGAALSARNIAAHIERDVIDKPRDWKPLVYCWRGGNRSGALATILGAIGFQVTLIEGGYKAWRAALVESLPGLATRLHYRVVCGPTGSGKTRLLHALAAQGAQVLDLEALANHRSSVLGHIPGVPQPSQKAFDSLIWDALQHFDPARQQRIGRHRMVGRDGGGVEQRRAIGQHAHARGGLAADHRAAGTAAEGIGVDTRQAGQAAAQGGIATAQQLVAVEHAVRRRLPQRILIQPQRVDTHRRQRDRLGLVAGLVRQLQTGRLYNYAFAMIIGLIVLLAVLVKMTGA